MPWIEKDGKTIVGIYPRKQVSKKDLVYVKDDDADLVAHREAEAARAEIENKIQAEINSKIRVDAIASLKAKGEIPQDYADSQIRNQ